MHLKKIIIISGISTILFSCSNQKNLVKTSNTVNTNNTFFEGKQTQGSANLPIKIEKTFDAELPLTPISWNDDFLLASGEGYKGLYIYELSSQKKIHSFLENKSVGYMSFLSSDNEWVYFREKEKYQFVVKRIRIKDGTIEAMPVVPAFSMESFVNAKNSDTYIELNSQLQVDGLKKGERGNWQITKETEPVYQPILSPLKNNIVVHKASHMYVYDANGKGLLQDLGMGLANAWLNNNWVLYHLDSSEDGHQISESSIYAINIKTLEKKKLTENKDCIATFPIANSNGSKVAFFNDSKNTLEILTITFNTNEK